MPLINWELPPNRILWIAIVGGILFLLLAISIVSSFWILHYEGVRSQAKKDKIEQEKLIDEVAKHRKDASDARKDRNQWIMEANRLKQKGAK